MKSILNSAARVIGLLLFGAVVAFGQQQVNLTAGPSNLTMPDGTVVPMWGYSCGASVALSTAACKAANPAALLTTPASWSPVVITVPTGQGLTINLTNSLPVPPGAATGIPTSLTIVGQLGGGLGSTGATCLDTAGVQHGVTCTTSPDHSAAQSSSTWPIAGAAGPTLANQGPRVQSFATEVATGATTGLTWSSLQPGTYLLESGTHPSIQGPMGLYGIVVVTTAPSTGVLGTAYPAVDGTVAAVTYNADIPLIFSEIDANQNMAVQAAVTTANFSETMVWSGQPGGCGNSASATYHQCYPPAVNYTPTYYMINGVAFDKTHASISLFPATAVAADAGTVLVRMVNAGLRMHVPSIVGSQTTGQTGTATPTVTGFQLIAEDGNRLPGVRRVQSEVFMAAGKTYDVMFNAPASGATALPVFDRELSLSGNATARDAGMLAYLNINAAVLPASPAFAAAVARADTYNSIVAGQTLTVSDPAKGVIGNDTNVYGVKVIGAVPVGLTLNTDGTFVYTAGVPANFTYCGNGTITGPACASVTLGGTTNGATTVTALGHTYTASTSTHLAIGNPGVLSFAKDNSLPPFPLTVAVPTAAPQPLTGGGTYTLDANGGFNANVPGPGSYSFTYQAQNSQGKTSTAATINLIFPTPTNLTVSVMDGVSHAPITDYRWIIEEDRTFFVNPNCTTTTTTPPAGCPSQTSTSGVPPIFGVNFHTSYMPVVATGCTGDLSCESGQSIAGAAVVCDIGNGKCRPDTTGHGETPVLPSSVVLDPTKRYYISVLPGDAGNPFGAAYGGTPDCSTSGAAAGMCGHTMGGAPIAFPAANAAVTVLVEPTPLVPSKLSVFVFEDDFPLNGEQDGGGGTGTVNSNNEPGLGQFNVTLFDDAGGTGDSTGQMTYDMFNQPLVNALAGTPDPTNGNIDACPISTAPRDPSDPTSTGITGTIVTCPQFEADGTTPSPLAGQVVVANMMPGRYGVVATPGADRIARGEEWLQTNTLDGQKAHDSFLRVGEPSFFQEYGPAGYHVAIGFANPAIINSRYAGICNGTDPTGLVGSNCTNTVTGMVTTSRMSRTPDQRLYSSGSRDSFSFTQCYVSFGDADGEDFAFTKCNPDGTFTLNNMPDGDWRITTFDQWNDQLVDGLSTPVRLDHRVANSGQMGDIAAGQWQANIYTSTFFDLHKTGVRTPDDPGLALVATNIRYRDGSFSNFNNTDLSGNAGFNEVFPLFSWYVVEADTTRYKSTGTHVIYDAGGPADGTPCGASANPPTAPCGSSSIAQNFANTYEAVPVPATLHVPGAVYCTSGADCSTESIASGPNTATPNNTGRIDPPWVLTEGWQGYSGQNSFLEFGKTPYAACPPACVTGSNMGENGGIHGHVAYASTRPFDDPNLLLQTSWSPLVPNVTINLYKEGFAADGVTPTLALVDHTQTSSFDAWSQGFRSDGVPNMNCPGQGRDTGANADLFFFSLFNQPNYLDVYNSMHGGPAVTALPANSQFKCYDGMHNWNQLQPAPYDGFYQFPSVAAMDPRTGKPTATNCTGCVANPDATDTFRFGTPMLPAGKYVVEMVVPSGYELVKEEDKNILIGDNYIAPVTQEFGGLGNIFILPDQAAVGATYNANNPNNPTTDLGRPKLPQGEGDTGSVEQFWPCVGEARIVPDYISLFPKSLEVAPFAGATRNLCDRKEITLEDQMSALAKFWVFTSTHAAAHFTGVITDDYTSEFDPFSPQFGEKFSPPDMPISIKDFNGNQVARTYADHWGAYNGLQYSTWEVNPPNPTGYAPTMMVVCMNDPGTGPVPDPLFNPAYSQFCYEIPFMPGQTQYMDTPVVPTAGFAGAGYNNVDCSYPDLTPSIREVDGDGIGPWVSATGHTITIYALGDQNVPNYSYSGPAATTAPYNAKTIMRHYGFGAQCTSPTSTSTTCNTASKVTIGGVTATIPAGGWSDTKITATVPSIGIPMCAVQQQTQYGGSNAMCGELVITAGNGKQSIDAVTVTVGGSTPTHVLASTSIQVAIDAAKPGDMLIIDPTCTPAAGGGAVACSASALNATVPTQVATQAAHYEMLLMWKPVRLQGVGAASSVINANPHPAGKVQAWRERVNCLFGLALNGVPITAANPYDSTGGATCGSTTGDNWFGFTPYGAGNDFNPQVDRLPLEATVGWDASLNGNLAEMLQEPSLMGALEGAAITVLAKGVRFPSNPFDPSLAAGFPTGTTLLTNSTSSRNNSGCGPNTSTAHNPFPSNFWCNPSSIDGLGITDSSQGGGGIFVHAWGHNLQIANNRIFNNAGTLSGGINIGQGEFAPAIIKGSGTNPAPYEANSNFCFEGTGNISNDVQLPYCDNVNVNVHNNYVTMNSSTGDELFSATPAGPGGVSFCTGADYYKFNFNWVCGNLGTGDGGGLGQLGFSYNGDIEHNSVLFNQSTNPTIPTNGGGIIIMGTPDADVVCPGNPNLDQDCVPNPLNQAAPSDGIGPGLVINANLIQGNAAESGSGGGIAFQAVNGGDVLAFPRTPTRWYAVQFTNNVVTDNVAGWDGGGISLLDSFAVNIINNTFASNNSTASAGPLFNTIGAPLASTPPGTGQTCTTGCGTASHPQVGGLVAIQNSAILMANIGTSTITCPSGHGTGGTGQGGSNNGACRKVSFPKLENNVFWQNSSYHIGVGSLGGNTQNQQYLVSLYVPPSTFNGGLGTQAPSQPSADATSAHGSGSTITGGTGACVASSYWDIGVRGDTGPTNHGSTVTLAPSFSLLTPNVSGVYTTGNNRFADPHFISQYCDGSRIPPEFNGTGWQVPPGISDATVPNPFFNLTPAATVDEGNNWVNISWGPLSLVNTSTGTLNGRLLGNYGPADNGGALFNEVNEVSCTFPGTNTNFNDAPQFDFYGIQRKTGNCSNSQNGQSLDAGAIEFIPGPVTGTLTASVTPNPAAFGNVGVGASPTMNLTVTNTGTLPLAGGTFNFGGGTPQPYSRINSGAFPAGAPNCTAALAVGASCTIKVQFAPTAAISYTRNLTVAYTGATVNPTPVPLTGTGVTPGTASFTAATNGTLSTVPILGRVLNFTIPTPRAPVTSVVTITNSGLGSLLITAESLSLNPGTLYSVTGTTCSFTVPLASGGACTVSITYATPTARPFLPDIGALNVTNNGVPTTGGDSILVLVAQ